ncbi:MULTISPECIES: TetR/AcrR family transcriptional regulator [Saccharibacillus]|uniref:TetR/AcrR family transcriptional regulator n=1 Tax=Saccharibacillus TaxID=456492 RepID=UPI00123BE388|nr:TetR/AcrR family transcriptional regulator [Saccharibacillus sp. WB 17]MWJ30516.1 TetR family transcriptional regulator [Saccharibacillus sp. WB 17]
MVRTGRPRSFDRDQAVVAAMFLFWEQGFESTSLAQLRAAMGNLSAASFYAAFESKEALFREAVEQYMNSYGRVTESFKDASLSPGAAVEEGLRRSARMQTEAGHPTGCMMVLSASTCSPENRHIREVLTLEREQTRGWLQDCVQRGISVGELPAHTDVRTLTTLFDTFMRGFSSQARDGVPLEALESAITQVMTVWYGQA